MTAKNELPMCDCIAPNRCKAPIAGIICRGWGEEVTSSERFSELKRRALEVAGLTDEPADVQEQEQK